MTYSLITIGNQRYLSLPEFLLDVDDVGAWMVSVRDENSDMYNSDLYAELVHIYFMLKKPVETAVIPYQENVILSQAIR